MNIVAPEIERYAQAHTSAPAEHLVDLARQTLDTLAYPQMMVGPLEGRFLEMLVFALRARSVLEIGTFSGYSALSMAAGLPPDGRIVTCELDPTHAEVAKRNIETSRWADRIEVLVGNARELLEQLSGPFDLVFIDADKAGYVDYFEKVLPKLAPHGLIVADNTLWSGAVLDGDDTSEATEAIRRFNDHVLADPRVACVQLTIRDGVTVVWKAT